MNRKRILVVDDALTVRMYCRDVLERAGFDVEEAGNGIEGLERALGGGFDLLFVDINMPRMDGYEMVRHLRERPGAARSCRWWPSAPRPPTPTWCAPTGPARMST